MLIGALGCNLAWGLVDAVMYVIASAATRGRGDLLLRDLHASPTPEAAQRMIAEVLPDRIAEVARPEDLETLRRRLVAHPAPTTGAAIERQDLLGALGVFALVFVSTFPVAIPFMLMSDALRAMRMSNAIALVMLFFLGRWLAKSTGGNPWRLGFGMLLLGAVLVAIIIALGG